MADSLPSWIVIGAMKAGTTTVHNWLGAQPECFVPATKELDFFGNDDVWANGVEWYRSHFAAAPAGAQSGESSPSYTLPSRGDKAAQQLHDLLPDVRLIFLVREPMERMRSHFEHNKRRRRDSRSLRTALATEGNTYVGRSLYHACLSPYIDRFPAEQICVEALEAFEPGAGPEAWHRVLRHIGLSERPRPHAAHNVTAAKADHIRFVRWLVLSGWWEDVKRLPKPVRSVAKRIATRPGRRRVTRSDVDAALPAAMHDAIQSDTKRLCAWLGTATPPWEPTHDDELSQP